MSPVTVFPLCKSVCVHFPALLMFTLHICALWQDYFHPTRGQDNMSHSKWTLQTSFVPEIRFLELPSLLSPSLSVNDTVTLLLVKSSSLLSGVIISVELSLFPDSVLKLL